MVKNLTEGPPLKLLFFFSLPMVAGNLFQQLYNMVDTAVVGKFVGEDAVAAVGSSFPIVFLAVAVAAGLSMEEENVEAFRQAINDNCVLTDEDFEEKITIDVPMPMSYVTEHFVEELSVLEPFGTANEKPVFAQKNIRFMRGYVMGKNRNMARFDVMDENGKRFTVVCFRNLDKLKEYLEQKEGKERTERLFANGLYPDEAVLLDVIYYPSVNEFRGKTSTQYILQDYR